MAVKKVVIDSAHGGTGRDGAAEQIIIKLGLEAHGFTHEETTQLQRDQLRPHRHTVAGMPGETGEFGVKSVAIYLLVYTFMNIGAFAMVILLRRKNLVGDLVVDFSGLARRSPLAAFTMPAHAQQAAGAILHGGAWANEDTLALAQAAGPDAPWEPVFDDPVFLVKLENFLRAFAARYDGKPWLRYVDIGSIGDWGEGHSWAGSRKECGFAARQALRNIVAVLAEAGAGPEHLVRLTWYVTDKHEYLARLASGASKPAEALLMVEEEGLEARWARHRHHHLALAAGIGAMGLSLLPPEGERWERPSAK